MNDANPQHDDRKTTVDLLPLLYPQPTATSRPGAWLRQRANEVVVLDDDTSVLLDVITGRLQRTFRTGPQGAGEGS